MGVSKMNPHPDRRDQFLEIMLGNAQFRNIQEGLILYRNKKTYIRRSTVTLSRLIMETISLLESLLRYERLREYAQKYGNLENFIGSFSLGYTNGGTLPEKIFAFYYKRQKREQELQDPEKSDAKKNEEEPLAGKAAAAEVIYNVSRMVNELTSGEIIDFYSGFTDNVVSPVLDDRPPEKTAT